MCLSIGEAAFNNTTIYSAEVQHPEQGLVHVLGYQNSAISYQPNAMLLPFPAEGKVTRDNLVNGAKFKDILKSYNTAVDNLDPNKRRARSMAKSFFLGGAAPAASYEVFESGSYTIALCEKPSALGFALKEIPADRRPELPYRFLLALTQLYPDWPIALCCFNRSMDDAEPLFWWYKPRFPNVLFAPAIDAHNGEPPDIEKMVTRDHSLAFASHASTREPLASLTSAINQVPAEHRWMFDARIAGREVQGTTGNRDFVVPVDQVRDVNTHPWLDVKVAKPPRNLPSAWDRLLGPDLV